MFKSRNITLTAALAVAFPFTASAQAPSNDVEVPTMVVTGNPLGSSLLDLATPVSVLKGDNLLLQTQSSLGETVSRLPGVSSSYFGPNASRPVIRGLDSDRVRIMQNGVGMLDLSALSPDHATTVDPLVVDSIEVVRGPATLLYGGSAIGGVVNVLDNRIPQTALSGIGGRFQARVGGADDERSGSVVLEGGNGQFAFHADANSRRNGDLDIPGYARSSRQRAIDSPTQDQPRGRLPNSAGHGDGGALGASLTFDKGYLGFSYADFNSIYGTVAEPDVKIDMRSSRWNLEGEMRDVGTFIDAIKFKFGDTDYQHQELESGVVGTTFKSKGYETRIEATHQKIGPLTGVFGVQFSNGDASAVGAEALLPKVETDAKAVFLFEEARYGDLTLSFGGRTERTKIDSQGGGPLDPLTLLQRFDPAQKKDFSTNSGALGAVFKLNQAFSLAANFAHTERAPTYAELFVNGPHLATGQYEVGNTTLNKERSNSLDLQLRWKSGPHSASISSFYSHFGNYLLVKNSGNSRGVDGELNPVDADADGFADGSGEEILPEAAYSGVKAKFYGFESEGKFLVHEAAGKLLLNLRGDYVRAENADTGEPLPRIPSLRFGAGLNYQIGKFGARLDVNHVLKQNRVAANELPTDAYTLVDAAVTYRFATNGLNLEAFAKINNLLDEEARVHTSVLKDIAPLAGRGLLIGLRGDF